MKKMLLLLVLIIAISLSSCNTSDEKNGMLIRPSQFSEETQKVLKIFDDEMVFYDYKVDDTVKFFSVDLWFYRNGEWVADGNLSDSIDHLNNRIAIRLGETEIDVFSIDESGGFTKYSFMANEMDFSNSTGIASTRMSNPTQIVLNDEIPLWVKWGTKENGIHAGSSSDFKNLDCNAGVAVTVTFSDKKEG